MKYDVFGSNFWLRKVIEHGVYGSAYLYNVVFDTHVYTRDRGIMRLCARIILCIIADL